MQEDFQRQNTIQTQAYTRLEEEMLLRNNVSVLYLIYHGANTTGCSPYPKFC